MFANILQKLIEKKDLTFEEARKVMQDIMEGNLTEGEISAFLVALRSKGETIDEIAGCASIMREKAITITPKVESLVDTCGTGGDLSNTFNISTTVAFIVAGCGIKVAKHGNKAASSRSGSADVLKALGVNIDLKPEKVKQSIEEIGIGFLFAPLFHPAMKNVVPIRQKLKIKTVFNLLGPLTNPAKAPYQVIGVFDENLTEVFARVLDQLGTKHALVVHGSGLDEVTNTGRTKITEIKNGKLNTFFIQPEDFSLQRCSPEDLKGGEPQQNAEITLAILKGEKGPKRDIVTMNAAAALLACDKAQDFPEGITMAEQSIDSGKALKKLKELKSFSKEV